MISPRNRHLAALGIVVCGFISSGLVGCSEKAPEQPQQSNLPERNYTDEPEQAPAPRRLTVRDLNLADGVEYPTPRIPSDAALARAIADFAGALKSGDADALRPLLTEEGQAVLSTLVESGDWPGASSAIDSVRVCTVLESGPTASVGLGVRDDSGAYLTGWAAISDGGTWTFSGLAIEPATASSLSALDGSPLTELALPIAGAPTIDQAAPAAPTDEPTAPQPSQPSTARPRG